MKGLWILVVVAMIFTGCGHGAQTREKTTTQAEAATTAAPRTTLEAKTEAERAPITEKEVATTEAATTKVEENFIYDVVTIDEAMAKAMTGKSFHENPHIALEDLRVVHVPHYGFDGATHQGSLVVHEKIAEDILEIFTELYEAQYPIEKMIPVDAYEGDDNAAMVDNNTSAFNYRVVAGTVKLSNHAYGLAIDINPLVNPWVTKDGRVAPIEGEAYADRSLKAKGMIHKGGLCYEAFTSRGFAWGGDWKNSKDYQHFDIKIQGVNQ